MLSHPIEQKHLFYFLYDVAVLSRKKVEQKKVFCEYILQTINAEVIFCYYRQFYYLPSRIWELKIGTVVHYDSQYNLLKVLEGGRWAQRGLVDDIFLVFHSYLQI